MAKRREGRDRAVAYGLTWLSYASYYLGRKGLPVAKVTLEGALGAGALRGVETAYLIAYAVGQYVNGTLGDRVGARRMIGVGMIGSAVACVVFGASSLGAVLLLAWLVNGYAQSTGWPGNIKAMAEWTPPERRGAVMGLWSTCYQVGGIVATSIAARMLVAWGVHWAFFGPALLMGVVGVLVLLFLRPGPLAVSPTPADPAEAAAQKVLRRKLLTSPILISLGASYAAMKLFRYAILFSAPKYLATDLGFSTTAAADISTAFEWGGVFGAIAIGAISDRLRNVPRAAVAAVSLLGLGGAFVLYSHAGNGLVANVLGLALIGFLLFGPDALVSGAAAQDVGGAGAAALAGGLVNAIGSVGAAFQEPVLDAARSRGGWTTVFQLFGFLSVLGAIALVPAILRSGRAPRDVEHAAG